AIFQHSWIKKIESRDDMTHDVAAVVHNDVWNANLVDNALQESCVLLRADVNFNLIFSKPFALSIDVDTDDSGIRPKVLIPHLQGAACSASDFDQRDRLVHKLFEMAFVNWKIVLPFVNQPLVVMENVRPKSHHSASNRNS